jgi:hypothetical protein
VEFPVGTQFGGTCMRPAVDNEDARRRF